MYIYKVCIYILEKKPKNNTKRKKQKSKKKEIVRYRKKNEKKGNRKLRKENKLVQERKIERKKTFPQKNHAPSTAPLSARDVTGRRLAFSIKNRDAI